MDTMFDTLMELPLFRGVGMKQMSKTVGACKFHFLKYLPGGVLFRAGDPCSDLAFIIGGAVRINIVNPDGRFSIAQTLQSPDVISPDFLFGRHTAYPGTVTAVDTVSVLRIAKNEYVKMLNLDPVFLFNYLNALSVNAQKSLEGILAVSTGELPERIAYWISALTQPRSTDIVMECRQRDLAALFGVPRASLRSALESLREAGLVTFTPTSLTVTDRSALLALLHNHAETAED